MHVIADFIRESTPTTGTGATIALGGSVDDSRTFASVMADGDTTDYYIEDPGVGREAGTATYGATNNELTLTVRASTNADARINLSGNAKIGIGLPGDKGSARSALDVLAEAATSSAISLAFNTWRTPNANRPTLVEIGAEAVTDGSTNGVIVGRMNESGGTTVDYDLAIWQAKSNAGNFFNVRYTQTFYVPAGGSYKIDNNLDPKGSNAIENHREFTL